MTAFEAKDWVGIAVGQALRLDATDQRDKARINAMLKIWKKTGALVVVERKDKKGEMRPYVEVGEAA